MATSSPVAIAVLYRHYTSPSLRAAPICMQIAHVTLQAPIGAPPIDGMGTYRCTGPIGGPVYSQIYTPAHRDVRMRTYSCPCISPHAYRCPYAPLHAPIPHVPLYYTPCAALHSPMDPDTIPYTSLYRPQSASMPLYTPIDTPMQSSVHCHTPACVALCTPIHPHIPPDTLCTCM